MSSLKLVGYYEDESEESYNYVASNIKSELEPIDQEFLDFAERIMQENGDDPEKVAKAIDTRIGVVLGGMNADQSRDATKQRLAELFELRTNAPHEETGFGD